MSVSTIHTLYFVDLDLLGDIPFEFKGQDLALFSSITLRIRRSDGVLTQISHTVDDGPNGKGHFEFSASDLVPGKASYEVRRIRVSDSKPETFPKDFSLPMQVRKQV